MYYSELVKRACAILYDAHRDDVDKGGYPYVFHPFYLATQMDGEDAVCTVLLHDVLEDHGDRYSFDALARAGFPEAVLRALRLLTHAEGVPYMDYVRALAQDPIARRVKLGSPAQHGRPTPERHAPEEIRPVSAGDSVFTGAGYRSQNRINVARRATESSFRCAKMMA